MSQRDENIGRLKLKKDEAVKLATRMHFLRADINRLTDRNRPSEAEDHKKLQVLVEDLSDAGEKHAALCREIRQLCEDLGDKMPELG